MAADSIGWLYLGRILTGVGNGMSSLVTSVYVSEVASSNARGTIYENEMGYSILFSQWTVHEGDDLRTVTEGCV